ncbi:hypothetical protein JTB14_008382 [Gonioctena quinquepunctata]|nr:hypothetical protein JTB14_008382 [Gonioctena quinquepunctata]
MSDPYEIEVRKLQNLFDEVSSGDEYADDSDSEREDRMIVSDHFSETEEEDIEEINEHNGNEGEMMAIHLLVPEVLRTIKK